MTYFCAAAALMELGGSVRAGEMAAGDGVTFDE
jgi:hypothetical protein